MKHLVLLLVLVVATARADALGDAVDRIAREAGCTRVAVALHDEASGRSFRLRADEWFHAASTIKVPVLVGLMAQIEAGAYDLDDPLHVRNRFVSPADGSVFTIPRESGANARVHDRIGRTMSLRELAHAMITTSSNLATNLLSDLVEVPRARAVLAAHELAGIDLVRGVADEVAHAAGIANRTTANGMLGLMRRMHAGTLVSAGACRTMLGMLFEQKYNSAIPAGLPADFRVAHKTGNISTIAHDVALCYPPGRAPVAPVALVVLTEWPAGVGKERNATIARITRAVHDALLVPAVARR